MTENLNTSIVDENEFPYSSEIVATKADIDRIEQLAKSQASLPNGGAYGNFLKWTAGGWVGSAIPNNYTQNFGGSLLLNSACENDLPWTGAVLDGKSNGLNIMKTVTAWGESEKFWVNRERLYRCDYWLDASANHFIGVNLFDETGLVTKNNGDNSANYLSPTRLNATVAGTFVKSTMYFGGKGNTPFSFGADARKARFYLASPAKMYGFVVKEVELSEAVPYNLPYLPPFQEVYDPATNDRGYWSGVAYHWYTTS